MAGAVLGAGWFFTDAAGDAERARIESFHVGVGPTYAQEIERMGHAKLTLATAADDPADVEMIGALLR